MSGRGIKVHLLSLRMSVFDHLELSISPLNKSIKLIKNMPMLQSAIVISFATAIMPWKNRSS